MLYGNEELHKAGEQMKFPAIVDTGSSNLAVPDAAFDILKEKWKRDVPELDCVIDDNFCQVMTPCDQVKSHVKPVALQLSGEVFELQPELYLHQAEGKRCQFAIHSNQLKGSSGNLFLIGDTMLRHLYQVYDFENETISLGVNTHSADKMRMYDAGHKPDFTVPLMSGNLNES